jgi:hypothetical protein
MSNVKDLLPLCMDWPSISEGDTFPKVRFEEEWSGSGLAEVRVVVLDEEDEVVMELSGGDGVTVYDSEAGGWDFEIDEFIVEVPAGVYKWMLVTVDEDGRGRTEFKGKWIVVKGAPEVIP